ncbi:MAG: glycine zipper family protein [Phycisphaerae bacterium]|nr:glycine zipper family protein [Phycisphaerae bacterium]
MQNEERITMKEKHQDGKLQDSTNFIKVTFLLGVLLLLVFVVGWGIFNSNLAVLILFASWAFVTNKILVSKLKERNLHQADSNYSIAFRLGTFCKKLLKGNRQNLMIDNELQDNEEVEESEIVDIETIPKLMGEYSLSEITGVDASGNQQEALQLEALLSELKSAWRATLLWDFVTICCFATFFFIFPLIIALVMLIYKRKYKEELEQATRAFVISKTQSENNLLKQLPFLKQIITNLEPNVIHVPLFRDRIELGLLYSEIGSVLYDPESDLLTIIETKHISTVNYSFDRKHLGSVSKSDTNSNAGSGAIGAMLGVAIAGLTSDFELDFGDAATAGIVGAIVGGNQRSQNQNTKNLFEEHAIVDLYMNTNILPHVAVDFGSLQNPAKRFYSFIQNAKST